MEALDEVREREISRLIERRAEMNPDPDEVEPGYVESVRRYRARRRRELRAAWYSFFRDMAESLWARAEEYDRRALKLLEEDERKG